LIVPDIIVEEGEKLEALCREHGVDLIYLLAPTTTADRRELILSRSRGFVYLVSVAGVTGARTVLPESVDAWVREVKAASPVPVAVGFGVGSPEQAARLARVADGVIVGSAIIDRLAGGNGAGVETATQFVQQLKQAVSLNGTA
jgi:tryptophan synthase alpha chain